MKLRSRPALTRIVLLYLVFAGLWFFLSDRLLATSVHETERLHQLHTLNDLAVAALTAITYEIIQRHLGQIEVTSEPRHGTTIRVRLPVELAGTARAA